MTSVFKWAEVKAQADDPPLNMELEPGQWALWLEPNPFKLSLYWDLARGFGEPAQGRIFWFNAPKPLILSARQECEFRRQFGSVDRNDRLIMGLNLVNNLALYYEYHLGYEKLAAESEAWLWLEKFDLQDFAELMGDQVPAHKLPIASLALALVKTPALFFLDRPRALFEADFALAWSTLLELKQSQGLPLVIFDQQPGPWLAEIEANELLIWPKPHGPELNNFDPILKPSLSKTSIAISESP
ncbi:MAG: hypothetical protein LBT86_08055 [Deltaproteobacteria bacterium]|jgi:ABC-type branched-subunit amino acid transport system ATPase component|nr:hypothetical protein [Deltaproteobacteria bacterium]